MTAPRPRRQLRTFPAGFIQVSRASMVHPAFDLDAPLTPREAYLSVYAMAAIADTAQLRRGQVMCSLRFLSTRFRWSMGRVQRFLARLSTPIDGAPALLAVDYHDGEDRTVITVLEAALSSKVADAPSDAPSDAPPARLTASNPGTSARRIPQTDAPSDAASDAKKRSRDKEKDLQSQAPELIAFAEQIVATLNAAQLSNHRIEATTYKPLAVSHPKTIQAAAELLRAGVSLEWATTYVRTEGLRFEPKQYPQILTLAYLRGGMLRDWAQRRQLELPPPVSRGTPTGAPSVTVPPVVPGIPLMVDRLPRKAGVPEKLQALLDRMDLVEPPPLTQEA